MTDHIEAMRDRAASASDDPLSGEPRISWLYESFGATHSITIQGPFAREETTAIHDWVCGRMKLSEAVVERSLRNSTLGDN